MQREVLNAMAEANEFFVDMRELNADAGRRAAEILGAEAALVTAGGFSGLILSAAACLTGSDEEKNQRHFAGDLSWSLSAASHRANNHKSSR